MPKNTDALAILKAITPDDPEMADLLKAAALNAELAQIIYAARTQAGLTQKQLADRIGTQQSVISRLEDADYEGHSLSMLQAIAHALNTLRSTFSADRLPFTTEYLNPISPPSQTKPDRLSSRQSNIREEWKQCPSPNYCR
jgi:transcriptional regulator with XRE-family HTH domain